MVSCITVIGELPKELRKPGGAFTQLKYNDDVRMYTNKRIFDCEEIDNEVFRKKTQKYIGISPEKDRNTPTVNKCKFFI